MSPMSMLQSGKLPNAVLDAVALALLPASFRMECGASVAVAHSIAIPGYGTMVCSLLRGDRITLSN